MYKNFKVDGHLVPGVYHLQLISGHYYLIYVNG